MFYAPGLGYNSPPQHHDRHWQLFELPAIPLWYHEAGSSVHYRKIMGAAKQSNGTSLECLEIIHTLFTTHHISCHSISIGITQSTVSTTPTMLYGLELRVVHDRNKFHLRLAHHIHHSSSGLVFAQAINDLNVFDGGLIHRRRSSNWDLTSHALSHCSSSDIHYGTNHNKYG